VRLLYAHVMCGQSAAELPKQYAIKVTPSSHYCSKHFFLSVVRDVDRQREDMETAKYTLLGSCQVFSRQHPADSISCSVHDSVTHRTQIGPICFHRSLVCHTHTWTSFFRFVYAEKGVITIVHQYCFSVVQKHLVYQIICRKWYIFLLVNLPS
jgi:hypothetical protein